MEFLFLFLIVLFGISKGNVLEDIEKNTADCTIIKTQQCMADLLKSAPLLFVSGKEAVDVKTRKEFEDCVIGITSCTTKLFANLTERSQKQKDFCGDNEDCYDDSEEEDEDSYSKFSLTGFFHCFSKHKNLFFGDIADAALDVLGSWRRLLKIQYDDKGVLTPTTLICHVIRKTLKSIKNITETKCGSGGGLLWPYLKIHLMSTQNYLYELCSLGSLLSDSVP